MMLEVLEHSNPGRLTKRDILIRGVDVWGADCRKCGRALVGEQVGISANLWVLELLPSITGYEYLYKLMRAVESMDAKDAGRETQSQISFPFV